MPAIDSMICVQDLSPRWGISASNLGHSSPIKWLGWLALVGGGADSCSRRRATVEHGGSPEFGFSRAAVVGFCEAAQSLASVRRLGRCLAMVRAVSSEAAAPRTCTEASSSSLLASQPINCSEWRRKNSNLVAT
jgi:hypothetical protein